MKFEMENDGDQMGQLNPLYILLQACANFHNLGLCPKSGRRDLGHKPFHAQLYVISMLKYTELEYYALMIPLRIAYRTSSARECKLSLRIIFSRCLATVLGLITSF